MKKQVLYVILLCSIAMLLSCTDDKHHSEGPTTIFSLSRYYVDLAPGDTAEVYVSGELEFSLECSDENIVTARREGRKAIITAMARGDAEVLFLTLFDDVACKVHVDETLLDRIDGELADATPRVSGIGCSLRYGVPGIMMIEGAGKLEFINIATAERVELTLAQYGAGIERIKVNGVAQDILSCTLYKETGNKYWYLVLVDGSLDGFWVVIER